MILNAFGLGIASLDNQGKTLAVYYPLCFCRSEAELKSALATEVSHRGANAHYPISPAQLSALKIPTSSPQIAEIIEYLKAGPQVKNRRLVATFIEEDLALDTVEAAYLKLSLLSTRQVLPHDLNLENLFAILPTVAWTNQGAIAPYELQALQIQAKLAGNELTVHSLDKFPRLLDYALPTEVRIADASRVRLGAYLGPGTTVMHEGFVNFNAGTEGPNMVEGRISAGVFVARGSDIGGGASLMGTLSGGNKTVISVGKDCLLGANAGCGIPLGNNCIIEAGLYLTAGAKVTLKNEDGSIRAIVKARELAGASNILFRRNSETGAIEAYPNGKAVELNAALHANN